MYLLSQLQHHHHRNSHIKTKYKQIVCSYIIVVIAEYYLLLMAPLEEIHNGVKPKKSHLKERTNQRPGPKPKPLSERLLSGVYKPPKPIQRIERSYSRERKIEVILFREYHRVLDTSTRLYRPPTFEQIAAFWKIPETTIRGWWDSQDTIIESKSRT